MAYGAAAVRNARPIPGAVATLGVSDRVTFLRKTYAHLGASLILFAAVTAAMIKYATEFSFKFSVGSGSGAFLLVFVLFMVANMGAQRLARSETSRGLQYLGLLIMVVAWSFMLQPLIWYAMLKFGNPADFMVNGHLHAALSGTAAAIISESALITLAIFIGLTLTVFVTKKDFSFMRGVLSIVSFAAIGVIIASLLFGFTLGALFSGFVILLMSGYILFQTSLVMSYFPPTQYVSAALMLFGTVATLFMHVLNIMVSMRDR
jgi:FtsH-binding integral membrane protein